MANGSSSGDGPTRTSHVEPSGPERRIGPYRVLRELGQGGMGAVYLAARADEQFQKRVAIKVIPAGADSAEVIRHFKRERQILAALNHPNIAKLLDGGTTEDGLPYFVMEHVEGEALLAYCDSRRLPISERLKLFLAVCSAVQYAHRNLVVHRDIKPGNILVAADGSPRLLDFGIAKLLNPEVLGEAPTATAMAMTPEYASPEQVRGDRITTATDVYSLGVVLYELLTGLRPYALRSRDPLDVMRAVAEQEPSKPSAAIERLRVREAMVPDGNNSIAETSVAVSLAREGTPARLQRRLRGDLDNIVMMALRKEPPRRYPSVEALAEDVRRHLEGIPVAARKGTLTYRGSRFVRRHRLGVLAATAVLALLVGFPVAMTVQSARVARERDRAQKERATAQRERETAQRVSAFLVDLFKVSDPSEARGNTVTAREVLDKGAAKITTDLKDQPEVRATMMDTMGNVYRNLGLFEKAATLLQEALLERRAVLGNEHPDVATSLHNLATVRAQRGEHATAEGLFREALAMRRRLLGNEHPDVAKTLGIMANVLYSKGDYAEAEALYREGLALSRKLMGNEHASVAMGLNNLALVLKEKGDYAGAESLQREALALWRRLLGSEHPYLPLAMNNLATLLTEKGEYGEAESLLRDALAMGRKLLGKEHPEVAMYLSSLADTLCRDGKPREAEPAAREALVIFKKALPGGHPYIAETESVLGGCLSLAERYEEAEGLLLASYPVLKARTGERSLETLRALERIVHLYELWGKPDQAARYRHEPAASAVKTTGAGS